VLKAGVRHEVKALERTVWYCIHPTRENDPAHVDEVLIEPACKGTECGRLVEAST
jgi:hypothetical protein